MTREMAELLDGQQRTVVFPTPAVDLAFARYFAGYKISVSRRKTDAKPDLERLEGYDDVWAICARQKAPPPGWRVFGRFYQKDLFIGLRHYDKRDLKNTKTAYDKAAEDTIEDWKRIFGTREPLRATEIGDYISGLFYDVDTEKDF